MRLFILVVCSLTFQFAHAKGDTAVGVQSTTPVADSCKTRSAQFFGKVVSIQAQPCSYKVSIDTVNAGELCPYTDLSATTTLTMTDLINKKCPKLGDSIDGTVEKNNGEVTYEISGAEPCDSRGRTAQFIGTVTKTKGKACSFNVKINQISPASTCPFNEWSTTTTVSMQRSMSKGKCPQSGWTAQGVVMKKNGQIIYPDLDFQKN